MSLAFRLIICCALISSMLDAKTVMPARPGKTAVSPAPAESPFPGPPYPMEARQRNIQGVVTVSVRFDEEGRAHCRVAKSSGSDLLDDNTVDFIKQHWINPQMAGRTIETPITYQMQSSPPNQWKSAGSESLEQILARENFTWVTAGGETHNSDTFDVKINGKTIPLTLDTGAPDTVVSRAAVKDADLTMLPNEVKAGIGMNGAIDGPAHPLKVDSFQIGKTLCLHGPVVVENLSMNFRRASMSEGLLGLAFLKANHAIIVVNPPVLFLNPNKAVSSALDTWMRSHGSTMVPLKYVGGHYMAPVRLDGFSSDIVLDTGASLTLLNTAFLDQHHFGYYSELGYGTGLNSERFREGYVKLKEIDAGDFPFGEQMVTTTEPSFFPGGSLLIHGLLGFDLLGSVYTVIDTASDRAYFRPSPLP